jgi:hypothetical protein
MCYTWDASDPRRLGLKFAGLGGKVRDEAQDRLGSQLRDLSVRPKTQRVI